MEKVRITWFHPARWHRSCARHQTFVWTANCFLYSIPWIPPSRYLAYFQYFRSLNVERFSFIFRIELKIIEDCWRRKTLNPNASRQWLTRRGYAAILLSKTLVHEMKCSTRSYLLACELHSATTRPSAHRSGHRWPIPLRKRHCVWVFVSSLSLFRTAMRMFSLSLSLSASRERGGRPAFRNWGTIQLGDGASNWFINLLFSSIFQCQHLSN